MNTLLFLSEAFIIAYLMRYVSYRLKVPSVSGYVIGGVLLGGSLLFWIPGGSSFSESWLFSEKVLDQFSVVVQIALAIIALSIGVELEWKKLRHLGRSILFITFFEAFSAFFLVTIVTYLVWKNIPLSLLLGAVSSATAPAATVAVIQQYRAKGPLTSTIIAVIGIDDAISFVIFAFAMAVTKGKLLGSEIDLYVGLLQPLLGIIQALVLGSVLGFFAAVFLSRTRDKENVMFIVGAVILFISGSAVKLDVSALLANMACGTVLVNLNPSIKSKIRTAFSSFMPIFYSLFFILGGAHLNVSSFPLIWKTALLYFICRAGGKSAGASLGALFGRAPQQVRKLIGFSLLPQVGAAIALALVVQHEFGGGEYGAAGVQLAHDTMNILLVTTLFTEFIGPYMTKISLMKAGEVKSE